jgi:hypothetical protein
MLDNEVQEDAPVQGFRRRDAHKRTIGKKEARKVAAEEIARVFPAGAGDVFYETAVTLAGTGATISTEDQWVKVKVPVPNNNKYALIIFETKSTGNTDAATFYFEDYRTGAQVVVGYMEAGDGDDIPLRTAWKVPLDNGHFRYKFDSTAGSPDFKVEYVAYFPD